MVEIGPDETTGSVYFDKLYPLGVQACLDAVALVAQGKAPRIPQDHSKATYDPPCDEKVAGLDWSKPGPAGLSISSGAATPSPGPPPPSGAKR